jgi:hypothetical protein
MVLAAPEPLFMTIEPPLVGTETVTPLIVAD